MCYQVGNFNSIAPLHYSLYFHLSRMGILKTIQTTTVPDADLLKQYHREQNQQILAELYLRYADLVYGVCMKYLEDQEAAKDAVMNIYQELVEKAKNHTIDNFKSWLYVVAKNHCLMELRKNKRLPVVPFDGQSMQSEDFSHLESVMEKEQQLDRLEICIERLNDEQKQTVKMFYLQNKCYNEITTATGFDWNKVRSLVQNGRRNLKNCMEENG